MQMRHAFARIRSAVDDDTVTSLVDAHLFREITGDEQKFSKESAIRFARSSQTWDDFFRHDQNMHRRLRIHILKGNRVFVLPNDLGRNFGRDNFFENSHEWENRPFTSTNISIARSVA